MLKKVALAGGEPETLCQAAMMTGASWGNDDTIVFSNVVGSPLLRVSAFGGVPEPVTSLRTEEGELAHSLPQILPGGTAVLFTVNRGFTPTDNRIAVQSFAEEGHRELLVGTSARFVPTGHLVFARESTLWMVPFDIDALDVTGPPSPVLEDVLVTDGPGVAHFTFAENGSLVYAPARLGESTGSTLVWVDRHGEETELEVPAARYSYPRISPDGTRITVSRGNQDVWVWDLSAETLTPLTFGTGFSAYGEWTHDAKRIVFSSNREGTPTLVWKAADFTGGADRLTEVEENQYPQAVSPDGSVLVFRQSPTPFGLSDLKTVALDGEPVIEDLLSTEFDELNAAVSPNGHWFAYQSDRSGEFEVYVRAFPAADSAPLRQISTSGGQRPVWGPEGTELFYVNDNSLFAVEIEMEPTFSRGAPTLIVDGRYSLGNQIGRMYDVDPITGDRFLMLKPFDVEDGLRDPSLNVVLNWFEELKERVPVP